jgi:hypothetical protein
MAPISPDASERKRAKEAARAFPPRDAKQDPEVIEIT